MSTGDNLDIAVIARRADLSLTDRTRIRSRLNSLSARRPTTVDRFAACSV